VATAGRSGMPICRVGQTTRNQFGNLTFPGRQWQQPFKPKA